MTVRYLVALSMPRRPSTARWAFASPTAEGPPFVVLEGKGLKLWLAEPGTSRTKDPPAARCPHPAAGTASSSRPRTSMTRGPGRSPRAAARSKPIKGSGGRQVLIDDPAGNPVELFEAR